MDEGDAIEVATNLNLESFAVVLDEMEPDMAADLLGEFGPAEASQVLEQMEEGEAIAPLLAYPADSAGGIMNLPPPSLRRYMTVEESFIFVRENYSDVNQIFYLYVLDRNGQLIGVVNLRALILADPDQTIEEVMQRDVISIQVDVDQEEVAKIFAHYDQLALPVVDSDERLVGVITIDDVVDVLEEEATEDIYHLAQVSPNASLQTPIPRALRNRLPWLYINLLTAILAATVVAFFQDTIAAVAVLAVFLPIVASEGGNAGNQTMTIVVRSLALGETDVRSAWPILFHELTLGSLHGILLGLSIAIITWLWQGSPVLGLVIGVAMFADLLVAATVGVLVPITLKRLGVDPALASGVFVTTATDVAGFAVFLGLATYMLAYLY